MPVRYAIRLWGLLLALWVSGVSSAQDVLAEHYQMTCLDLSSGLPNNHVNQFFVDSRGFVWVSTYGGGAVRYDGFSFMSIALATPQGWMSKSSKSIAEDSHHRLWIAYDEQTDVIDMRTMSRVIPSSEGGVVGRLLGKLSVRVYTDSKDALWHVCRDTIFRYTFADDGSVSHVSHYRYQGNTPDVTIKDIEQNGTVWVNMDGGLYRLAEVNGQLVRSDIAPVMSQLEGLYVTDLLKKGAGVWIATNQGLYAFDQFARTLRSYRHSADPQSLSHDYATSLAVAPSGSLLVGTLRGLNTLHEATGTFTHWDSGNTQRPLPSDFIHCLMARDGQLWIGTETAGVVKLSPRPLLLASYVHDARRPASLSPRPVNAMYVEADGTLWAGTVEGGLNRKAPGSQEFVHWTTQNSALSHNAVSVLEPDSHGQLWIGTWGGGLNRISLAAPHALTHIDMPADMVGVTNYIGSLTYDPIHDALWIGSNDGVFLYDLKTGRLDEPFEENRLVRGSIGAIIDHQGQLWMGCMTGVRVIDLRSRQTGGGKFKVRTLQYILDHPESRIVDHLSCFCEASDSTLWLGSNGYGLYRRVVAEDGKETFEVLTTDDGLANNSVKGIVEDTGGRLWVTTANGLSVYDPRARTFINYTEQDGLHCQRFYWNSVVKGTDGMLYLGSMDGIIEVKGENADARYPVHLTFTRLMVDNQMVTATNSDFLDADISQAEVIRLHESNKSITLEFSALTYAGETTGYYSYRLKGFEDEWTRLNPGEHSVRYTSLQPGSYTFEVRYTPGLGDSDHQIAVRVEVTPYFWRSWWFRLLLVLALIPVAYWLARRKERQWKREEAEKLLTPIRKVLEEADEPRQLQSRIQNILDNHERLRQSFHKSVEADKQKVMLHSKPFMDQATEILEQHYTDSEFGVSEFAELIGMSKPLLSKRLNAEAGMSTGQFIRNYRLTIAKRLLLENYADRNITEIAYKVGFNDPKYFTRCFTRQYGCSPSAFAGEDE